MKLELPRLDLGQLEALKGDVLRTLSARETRPWIVVAAALVVGLGVWYLAFAQPAASRVAGYRARHQSAQRQLQTMGSTAAVDEVRARVAALEAGLRQTVERMAQDVQLVQVLKQLSSHAERYQIAVDRIEVKTAEAPAPSPTAATPGPGSSGKPEPDKKEKGEAESKPRAVLEIRTQRIELALVCSWEAAARFADELRALPAFVVVDKLELEREPAGFPNLRVLLTLKFHSLKQLPEELRT
jgi:type II secretory pathway component PulM